MTRNEFQLLYSIYKHGVQSYRSMKDTANVSIGFITKTMRLFSEKGYIEDDHITSCGLDVLEPYKVQNAIIMAAGMGTHFVPFTLEKPKGLLMVKNEVLIERQIEQLQEAGIENIVLVLGYMKEAFFYLEQRYHGIKIIINPAYNTKNNTYTLYLAQKEIGNSYICSADDYFVQNPFELYVYQSFYAGVPVSERTREWYMIPNSKGNLAKIRKNGSEGIIMLGHAYWDRAFSEEFLRILREDQSVGEYDSVIWEQVLLEHVKDLPAIEVKQYPRDMIFEFDSLEDLREFDHNYVEKTNIRILKNISNVLGCQEQDVLHFRPIKEGMTNTSFVFEVYGQKYVYRHPGEGTEEIISRKHEKEALELAKSIEVDPTFLHMNSEEGWKISKFVDGTRIPDYHNFEDSKRVLSVLRKLHEKKLSVSWEFLPWEEANRLEVLIRTEKGGIYDRAFEELKENVKKCWQRCQGDGVEMCFCHCDTYAPNWMLTDTQTILIDWEYAGNADPGCDVGSYITDSMWEIEEAKAFIQEYFCGTASNEMLFHYLAYTAVLSFYWYVWALYRESCGAVMGESLYNWRVMAKRYSDYLVENFDL